MTFGMRNAGQIFQRYIFQALGDLDFAFAYIDEILIASASVEEHKNHLSVVFDRLKKHGLQVNMEKYLFGKYEIEFFGHIINEQELAPTPQKVEAVSQFPKPRTVVELRRFLGLANFYRRSIRHVAQSQAPLNLFLQDSRKTDKCSMLWNSDAEAAFSQIKNDIANTALLAHSLTFSSFSRGSCFSDRHRLEAFALRMEKACLRQQRQLSFIS